MVSVWGVTTTDYDSDGWPDIFISVDHEEEDIVLHNNQDGTFEYVTHTALKQNSRSSMGIDAGDVNNDPYPDIMVVEMLPSDYYREKASMSMQTVQRFNGLIFRFKSSLFRAINFIKYFCC